MSTDQAQPSPQKSLAYRIGQPLTRAWFRGFHDVQWLHPERVPETGPVLVVANHQSYYDPPLIGAGITSRPLDYLARAGLFKNPVFGRFISTFNAFPIKEDSGDRAALEAVIGRLHAGGAVLLFPEGRRTRDGHVMSLKRGMALVLRKARCPLLPVAIDGVFDVFPPGQKRPSLFHGPIGVHYGEPIMPDELPRHAGPLLTMLHDRLEAQRLELRLELLKKSGGRFPAPLSPKTPPAVE
ncbi:MAG: lysophospholipid acyltransferase family protein [Phycisphaerales bacterium]